MVSARSHNWNVRHIIFPINILVEPKLKNDGSRGSRTLIFVATTRYNKPLYDRPNMPEFKYDNIFLLACQMYTHFN